MNSKVVKQILIGYSRNHITGHVDNYYQKDVANTLHTSSGSGGNTDQFIIEIYDDDENTSEPIPSKVGGTESQT